MSRNRILTVAVLTAMLSLPAVQAHAFDIGGVKSPLGGGSKESGASVDIDALVAQGNGLMEKFRVALLNMNLAQAKAFSALDMKKEGEIAQANATFLESGNVENDLDVVKRTMVTTVEGGAKIKEKFAEGYKLDAEGRKILMTAVPHYAKGVAASVGLPKEFQSWASSVQSGISSLSSNPMGAMKLKDQVEIPLHVAMNLPNLLSLFGTSTQAFLSFAQSNEIDVSAVKGDQLGSL